MWVPSLGWEDPLGEEMVAHSSIPARRIPWTEEAGGVQSTGSQRAGQDRAHVYFDLVYQNGAVSRLLYYISGNSGSDTESSDNIPLS